MRPGEGGVEGDEEGLGEQVSPVVHKELGGGEVEEGAFDVCVRVHRRRGSKARRRRILG